LLFCGKVFIIIIVPFTRYIKWQTGGERAKLGINSTMTGGEAASLAMELELHAGQV